MITRVPGGRAHEECFSRGYAVGRRKRERTNSYGLVDKDCAGFASLPDGTSMPYRDYLKSPQWRKVRLRRLKKDKYSCVLCESRLSLEVHHLTYRRLGWELLSDLRTLCHECHCKITDSENDIGRYWGNHDLVQSTRLGS